MLRVNSGLQQARTGKIVETEGTRLLLVLRVPRGPQLNVAEVQCGHFTFVWIIELGRGKEPYCNISESLNDNR